MPGSPSNGVMAWRSQFGDQPPDISRKITACVACRKMKIKCHMRDSGPPCTRCKKRGLPCSVNKSLQMILESDTVWKHEIDARIQRLEAGLGKVAGHLSLPGVVNEDHDDEQEDEEEEESVAAAQRDAGFGQLPPPMHKHTPQNYEIVMDPDSGPAAIPGSVVSPVLLPGIERLVAEQDMIARRVITMEQAQSYLNIYQDRLDHFLYSILGDRRSLSQIRQVSPLLLAAICAVGALHLAAPDFEKCYQEFVTIAAAQTFSRKNTIDDIRGLCIGAFWLSGISWTCIGAAVRMSTEIQLHRSIFKALAGDRTHYLRTRLYYLVYVCDHHFSVAYGRPPMTRDDESIRAALQLLKTENAVEDDNRLVSQVQFWLVGSDIYDTFGVDVDRPLSLDRIEPLRRFSIRLDGIRADWTEAFSRNQYVGNYPRKGVGLHYHFAKLYLYSMAFRGIGKPGFKAPEVALDIDELANSAVLSATSILRAVTTDPEIQSYLNGLPTYFDLMIAFAVVFVLKVSTKFSNSVRVDTSEIQSLVAELVRVLKDVTSSMHSRHMLVSVANGAERLLQKCNLQNMPRPGPSNAAITMNQPTFDESLHDISAAWNEAPFDNFFSMGEFDLLSDQDPTYFQPDLQYQAMQGMQ